MLDWPNTTYRHVLDPSELRESEVHAHIVWRPMCRMILLQQKKAAATDHVVASILGLRHGTATNDAATLWSASNALHMQTNCARVS